MLKLQNVSVRYQNDIVLENISLQVKPGDFIALVGPNGSGKSTLLKAIVGQQEAEGKISLYGKLVNEYGAKERAALLAYFPQNRPIPNMDVYTLVSHGRYPHLGFGRVMQKKDYEKTHQALEQTGLWDLRYKLIENLSGGERQRAYLAMVITQDSEIILLDELSAFLDIEYQIEMLNTLKVLNKEGKTIIVVTHDLPSAFTYADRVIVLNKGKILSDASPSKAASSPSFEQTFGVKIEKQKEDALFDYFLK